MNTPLFPYSQDVIIQFYENKNCAMCPLLGFEDYIAQCIITGLENNHYYSPKCGTAQIVK